MSILSEDAFRRSLGDGVTRVFAAPAVQSADDLEVYVAGVAVVGGYAVSNIGNPAASTVTFDPGNAPAAGATVLRLRAPALTQTAVYNDGDGFPAVSHEQALDRRAMAEQFLAYRLNRALRVSDADAALSALVLAGNAGKVLAINANGTDILPVAIDGGGLSAATAAIALAKSNIYPASLYGITPGMTGFAAALNALIASVSAAGGGDIVLLPGDFAVEATIDVKDRNVRIHGAGGDMSHDAGSGGGAATRLTWSGASGGTMVKLRTPYGLGLAKLYGQALTGLGLNGALTAAIGVQVDSTYGGVLSDLFVTGVTTAAYDYLCGTTGTDLPAAADTQNWLTQNCNFRLVDDVSERSAIGFRLRGGSNANTSLCKFLMCGGRNYNGAAWKLENCDNIVFERCGGFRSAGTGYTFDISGPTASTMGGEACLFVNCYWDATYGVILRGTEAGFTAGTTRNTFIAYDNANGAQPPVLGTGSRCFNQSDNGYAGGLEFNGLGIGGDNTSTILARTNRIAGLPLQIEESGVGFMRMGDLAHETVSAGIRRWRSPGGTITRVDHLMVQNFGAGMISKGNAAALTDNDTFTFEKISNTVLRVKMRGSDGTTRTTDLTLA